MNGLAQLLPFILIAVVFWLLLIRPQRRRQQEMAQTQRSVQVGDEVMLGSGIFGEVAEADDDEVLHIEVSPGVRIKVSRQAVVRVIREPELEPEPGLEPAPGPEGDQHSVPYPEPEPPSATGDDPRAERDH